MVQEKSVPVTGGEPVLQHSRKLYVFFYLLHLALPAFLCVDIAAAWLRGEIAIRPASPLAAVGAISSLWLLLGLGFLILSRDRRAFLQRVSVPLMTVYAIYFSVIFAEVVSHVSGTPPPIRYAGYPGLRAVTPMDPKVYPGISGTKIYTTNRLGVRGPLPPKPEAAYRIVMIGGSTTICATLDDSEEWPHLVMTYMNASHEKLPVWVGNAGVNGARTVRHIKLLHELPGTLHVDMAIFLVGVNDLSLALAWEGKHVPDDLTQDERDPEGSEAAIPASELVYPMYRRLKLFSLTSEAAQHVKQRFRRPPSLAPADIVMLRKRRGESPVMPLPDLSVGMKEYRGRLILLADRCRYLKIRCLFLTQPTMWRADVSPAEDHLFWLGYYGRFSDRKGYVSAGDLARGMDLYNRTLLTLCQESGLECYDMASHIPKDTSAFFDEMHFNEAGARLVARSLQEYLLSKPPFAPALNSTRSRAMASPESTAPRSTRGSAAVAR